MTQRYSNSRDSIILATHASVTFIPKFPPLSTQLLGPFFFHYSPLYFECWSSNGLHFILCFVMTEICIVCLGELGGESPVALPRPQTQDESPSEEKGQRQDDDVHHPDSSKDDLIAHLLPCGHNLHDECLEPWVERANSCPICRAKFNSVELYRIIGGES